MEAAAEKATAIAKKKLCKELDKEVKAKELQPTFDAVMELFLFGDETVDSNLFLFPVTLESNQS